MKGGPDLLEGLSKPREHLEAEPAPEGDVEWEPGRNLVEEVSRRPQEGSALITDGEDKEGREWTPSSYQDAGAETEADEDEATWFKDWWTPPVKASE
ncbi:hypothetical protein NDU88_004255 [Pleurodeles waltl]|uniref:Uncharacterized protein n=1 Tax=Pleurodeles waltl TaxID=8319 RepID=A0AAV7TRY7_PLEWA|nr:hypothetical protein NDU88_004255 [Pleurodeles waltl]